MRIDAIDRDALMQAAERTPARLVIGGVEFAIVRESGHFVYRRRAFAVRANGQVVAWILAKKLGATLTDYVVETADRLDTAGAALARLFVRSWQGDDATGPRTDRTKQIAARTANRAAAEAAETAVDDAWRSLR